MINDQTKNAYSEEMERQAYLRVNRIPIIDRDEMVIKAPSKCAQNLSQIMQPPLEEQIYKQVIDFEKNSARFKNNNNNNNNNAKLIINQQFFHPQKNQSAMTMAHHPSHEKMPNIRQLNFNYQSYSSPKLIGIGAGAKDTNELKIQSNVNKVESLQEEIKKLKDVVSKPNYSEVNANLRNRDHATPPPNGHNDKIHKSHSQIKNRQSDDNNISFADFELLNNTQIKHQFQKEFRKREIAYNQNILQFETQNKQKQAQWQSEINELRLELQNKQMIDMEEILMKNRLITSLQNSNKELVDQLERKTYQNQTSNAHQYHQYNAYNVAQNNNTMQKQNNLHQRIEENATNQKGAELQNVLSQKEQLAKDEQIKLLELQVLKIQKDNFHLQAAQAQSNQQKSRSNMSTQQNGLLQQNLKNGQQQQTNNNNKNNNNEILMMTQSDIEEEVTQKVDDSKNIPSNMDKRMSHSRSTSIKNVNEINNALFQNYNIQQQQQQLQQYSTENDLIYANKTYSTHMADNNNAQKSNRFNAFLQEQQRQTLSVVERDNTRLTEILVLKSSEAQELASKVARLESELNTQQAQFQLTLEQRLQKMENDFQAKSETEKTSLRQLWESQKQHYENELALLQQSQATLQRQCEDQSRTIADFQFSQNGYLFQQNQKDLKIQLLLQENEKLANVANRSLQQQQEFQTQTQQQTQQQQQIAQIENLMLENAREKERNEILQCTLADAVASRDYFRNLVTSQRQAFSFNNNANQQFIDEDYNYNNATNNDEQFIFNNKQIQSQSTTLFEV